MAKFACDHGGSAGEITDYFKGPIDEVKVFGDALSAEEIQSLLSR